ncbi:Carboxypeptidase cpdS [Taphrina deformans PYCC 5710]|uniref:Carboxypeptidase n=1 Tax=Taphrina deformans (strain PYCC 5710 / ATCC 11124 / CBS 356.35 / IMI 108563 / JCM 9778 / NBRC 8474) TaxID=1097556 RepID=R4XFY1_TAPDE|nr:Carboxypeptidase cpdS [Taphrina deformans PYCC 5710]|eukprot:CCG82284.1 Carboxypeptidase cpdS [Taphrina deformans PYCC 5710]
MLSRVLTNVLALTTLVSSREVQRRSIAHLGELSLVHKRSPLAVDDATVAGNSSFLVNGTGIPDVNFDVGDSYAGLMPISSLANETKQLYFWYFPSANASSTDITFWLNGGPGCSSLEGLLQENGPFIWQYGTYLPVPNPYSWTNLTNMVWVEQPVGTGFTQGTPDATGEFDVSQQFLGFLQQFFQEFPSLQNKNMYISGESYAGRYIPYIASAVHNYTESTNATSFNSSKIPNLKGTMIYDGVYTADVYQSEMTANRFVQANRELWNLNSTFMAQLANESAACGYEDYLNRYLVYPAVPMPAFNQTATSSCDLWDEALNAAFLVNPCFNLYHITDTCPLLWDVLGFPGSFEYTPPGATIYFNRTDVQTAINAPVQPWSECTSTDVFLNGTDSSPDVYISILPGVIERNERTIIGQGNWDYIIMSEGTKLAIQNMTWGGKQGFDTQPSTPFIVEAEGTTGIYHEERGLTYIEIAGSGHMVPQYAPGSAYKMLQYLLGQIGTLDVSTSGVNGTGTIVSSNATEYRSTLARGIRRDSF